MKPKEGINGRFLFYYNVTFRYGGFWNEESNEGGHREGLLWACLIQFLTIDKTTKIQTIAGVSLSRRLSASCIWYRDWLLGIAALLYTGRVFLTRISRFDPVTDRPSPIAVHKDRNYEVVASEELINQVYVMSVL